MSNKSGYIFFKINIFKLTSKIINCPTAWGLYHRYQWYPIPTYRDGEQSRVASSQIISRACFGVHARDKICYYYFLLWLRKKPIKNSVSLGEISNLKTAESISLLIGWLAFSSKFEDIHLIAFCTFSASGIILDITCKTSYIKIF